MVAETRTALRHTSHLNRASIWAWWKKLQPTKSSRWVPMKMDRIGFFTTENRGFMSYHPWHVMNVLECNRFEAASGGIEVFLEVFLFWPYFGEPLYHPVWFPHSCSTVVSGVEFEIISFVSWQAKRGTCRPQLQKMWKKHRRPRQSPDTFADSHGSLIVLVCGQSKGWLLSFLASFVCKNQIDFRWPRKLPRRKSNQTYSSKALNQGRHWILLSFVGSHLGTWLPGAVRNANSSQIGNKALDLDGKDRGEIATHWGPLVAGNDFEDVKKCRK